MLRFFFTCFLPAVCTTRVLLISSFLSPFVYFYYTLIRLKYDPENFIDHEEVKQKEINRLKEKGLLLYRDFSLYQFPLKYGPYKKFFLTTKKEKEALIEQMHATTLNSIRRLFINGEHHRNKTGKMINLANVEVDLNAKKRYPEDYGSFELMLKTLNENPNPYYTKEHELKMDSYKVSPFLRRSRPPASLFERLYNFFLCFLIFIFGACFLVVV